MDTFTTWTSVVPKDGKIYLGKLGLSKEILINIMNLHRIVTLYSIMYLMIMFITLINKEIVLYDIMSVQLYGTKWYN